MRTQFTRELVALTQDLTQMCRLAHDAAERVTHALADADLTATYEVFALDEQLQKMYAACEARTVVLLALQAPVARDLRHVVTAIQIAGELSRIGRLTSGVADQVYRAHPEHVAAGPVAATIGAMGRLATERTAIAVEGVANGRPATDHAAAVTAMRALHGQLRTELAGAADRPVGAAIDLALLGHNLERCVDHTGRIDRLIRFLETGVPPTAQGEPGDTPGE
ncbi:phosphate signaling complex PhoU family protein [Nocardia harenae]|uniref:phosphate signaling complex PhoU family protein n=1 Tax=Nocardia harenae TaxID=358707 RepID=UPI00082B9BFE|nr:PhoU domain-containing protein [Nocardia harenae]